MPTQPKRKRAGRPKLPKGAARAGKIQVRLSPDEQKRIEAMARSTNQTLSEWIRSTLAAAVEA